MGNEPEQSNITSEQERVPRADDKGAVVPAERRFDLEDRTSAFAIAVRSFLRLIRRDSLTVHDVSQLLRSSGSVGANYIEANESFSKRDLVPRIKICRKEAKESELLAEADLLDLFRISIFGFRASL